MATRPLMIFGMKGILLDRVHTSAAAAVQVSPTFSMGSYRVWLRPFVIDALTELSSQYDLAVWSSATHRNTIALAATAFPDIKFRFVWCREHTTPDEYRRNFVVEDDDTWATLKPHGTLLANFPELHKSQFVLVDDTPSKLREVADRTLILPSFDITSPGAAEDSAMKRLLDATRIDGWSDVLPKFV
jgi:hypothetical protein